MTIAPLVRSVILAGVFLTAACAADAPTASPTFQDMKAEQTAIQAALNAGESDVSIPWQGPSGISGTVMLMGKADAEGCREVETTGPGGAIMDIWCPTPHGFWVHPDEQFYRNATGKETYGGGVRSGPAGEDIGSPSSKPSAATSRTDCLRLLHQQKRLSDDGRDSEARAMQRAFHRCLQQSD